MCVCVLGWGWGGWAHRHISDVVPSDIREETRGNDLTNCYGTAIMTYRRGMNGTLDSGASIFGSHAAMFV